jgi:putative ABC transport system ATP-binding protein
LAAKVRTGAAQAQALLHARELDCGSVSGANFELAAGERIVLSGPSGSGKTRLLRALADLDPHRGEVYLRGRACSTFPGHVWRREVALLPAESVWWAPIVREHMSGSDAGPLAALGLEAAALDWPVERLSSGEKQRLALLRLTLGRSPAVLLLDEPTANLDPESAARVERYLLDLSDADGIGLLWVSHDPDQAARVAHRRFAIEDGRLKERA